jgi:alkylation response protein AidB-like acyl-CoA dehydrogenase
MSMHAAAFETFRHKFITRLWEDIAPMEEEIEATDRIPWDRLRPILLDIGAFGLLVPKEYGGSGLSVTQYVPLLAELSKIHGGIRAALHVHNSAAKMFLVGASEEQRRAILPGLAQGKKSVAFALTEPDHGTGKDLGTTARRDGDQYVVNGRKWLITNSDFASHFFLVCRTAREDVSVLLVDRDQPGLTIEPLAESMGCKGSEHGVLTFRDARVPVANRIGEEGTGIEQALQGLELSRLFIAIAALGTAEYSLELSLAHAKRRVTFGKPIAARQAVQRYLAEMATDIHALREIVRDAAAKADEGRRIPVEASVCKLFGLEAVGRVTDRALLVHGGIGYTRKTPIDRLYRDARLNWLEEGTPTIQQLVIARELLEGRFPLSRRESAATA